MVLLFLSCLTANWRRRFRFWCFCKVGKESRHVYLSFHRLTWIFPRILDFNLDPRSLPLSGKYFSIFPSCRTASRTYFSSLPVPGKKSKFSEEFYFYPQTGFLRVVIPIMHLSTLSPRGIWHFHGSQSLLESGLNNWIPDPGPWATRKSKSLPRGGPLSQFPVGRPPTTHLGP